MSRHDPATGTGWVYGGLWSGLIRWLRVPEDPPTLPAAPGEPVESFRPAPGFLRYLRTIFWIVIGLIGAAVLTLLALLFAVSLENGNPWIMLIVAPIALVLALVPAIIGYVALHVRFDSTYYVITGRSLRIRRGVWIIQETTITFENIQNMRISRGPLQQLFGVADLVVETAGSGGSSSHGQSGGGSNQGIIQGIDHAEALRDRILPSLRTAHQAGLGDEDETDRAGAGPAWSRRHLDVLREIRDLAVSR